MTPEERELLRAMASDAASDDRTRKRARAVLTYLETGDLSPAADQSGLNVSTVRKWVSVFEEGGWQALLSVPMPRGGDFLARYDQGFWAERLVRACLDQSQKYRGIPYGTSRSEPFTDLQTFRDYVVTQFLLQAWSGGERWKRPDVLIIPRSFLAQQGGHDAWTPDLQHWDNERCEPFVKEATAAVEVETSLWEIARATVELSFTVKDEDLETLRNWVRSTSVPLYIVQIFYDRAFVLPFSILEYLIDRGEVAAEVDRTTNKATYMVPLSRGVEFGMIPEPDVEGRVFKAPNGRVTVYGRLTGSRIEVSDRGLLEALASGHLSRVRPRASK